MEDTVTKASAYLGGPVNAALAILLAADSGYSWVQIVDAIEVGNIMADGSIPGVSPEGAPQEIITVSEQSLVPVENTSLIKVSKQPLAVDTVSLVAQLGEFTDPKENVLAAIVDAICKGYSLEQIILAIMANTLRVGGWIACLPPDPDDSDCYYEGERVTPVGKDWKQNWSNCVPPNPPNIAGKWRQYGYNATIVGSGFIYKLTGTGDGNFKHIGTINWYNKNNWYEGNLTDVEGFCCGNIGYIWIKVKDENTLSIKSYWTTPDGILVKDNTEVWTDLFLVSRDVDNF
jgi:hypothetical protein